MVKLRVIRGFYDLESRRYRPTGETFEAKDDRANEILASGVAEVIEVLAAPTEETAAKATEQPKNKRKKG